MSLSMFRASLWWGCKVVGLILAKKSHPPPPPAPHHITFCFSLSILALPAAWHTGHPSAHMNLNQSSATGHCNALRPLRMTITRACRSGQWQLSLHQSLQPLMPVDMVAMCRRYLVMLCTSQTTAMYRSATAEVRLTASSRSVIFWPTLMQLLHLLAEIQWFSAMPL